MMNQCKHRNIIITVKTHYYLKEGYDKVIEKDDVDWADYEGDSESTTRCQDCGKVLEETWI